MLYRFKGQNYFLPRAFVWNDVEDEHGLCCYIDALIYRDHNTVTKYEKAGIATEHTYEEPSESDGPIVRLSPERIMALLRGEDVLEAPANTRLIISKKNGKPIRLPDEALLELVCTDMLPLHIAALRRMVGEGKPILYYNGDLSISSMSTSGSTTGEVLRACEQSGLPSAIVPGTEGEQEAAEVVVCTRPKGNHAEVITLVSKKDERPFFVRRLMVHTDVIWTGTSYSATGPWNRYEADEGRLLALGINP